jgi:tRNA threonylcarbamoyladenosine biosynthesis protein TsaE
METFTYDITDTTDLAIAAEALLNRAQKMLVESPDEAVVLALTGDLGAGKTTLVQLMARVLGVTDTVTSPTFVVMKQYETTNETFTQLVHIDAYRIEDIDEMRPLGFTALLAQPGTLMCIEWAERIETLLPPHTIAVTVVLNSDETRTLTINS